MLILYTPVPLADTGTAVYAAALLDELIAQGGPPVRDQTVVAIDGSGSEVQGGAARSQGWTVRDFRSLTVGKDDLCVYFLASNQYHYYCYEQLALQTRGRAFGVIHDLTAGFFIREMSEFLGSPYAGLRTDAFQHDFGPRTASLLRDYDKVHDISRYFIAAQGVTLAKCEGVIVHSYYAKAKLLLETGGGAALGRKISVCVHPTPCIEPGTEPAPVAAATAETEVFRVGSLGYYSIMKRFPSVVSAWSDFLARYRIEAPCELLLGGHVPRKERRRLLQLCDERFRDTISFVGFLDDEELHGTIRSLDLVIALRFPSCGETSGIVAHCLAYDTPIALSEFAAFREEPAAFRISPSAENEVQELTAALKRSYDAWSSGARVENSHPTWPARKASIARTLLGAVNC
jgi:hypothetical protein